MRFSSIVAALVVLFVPQVLTAQSSTGTVTSTSTMTITKTVVQATATSTIHGPSPTATSTKHSASLGTGLVGAQGTGLGNGPAATGKPSSTMPPYSFLGSGASTERSNLVVAFVAGGAALVLGASL